MTEHKYTDEEVIKALELCFAPVGTSKSCKKCPFHKIVLCKIERDRAALDLLHRQKAEIERLTIDMNAARLGMIAEHERLKTARTEAIKEFAEWLEALEEVVTSLKDGEPITAVETYYIHEFVKKFTEEKT